ncbi:rhodanese-like domain-containing protein [Planctomycetes bacterium K23_9]|uniref:Thiosulfate sulfurtransferase PspE n=1 Tax=Stieleria marina TaxID=1930275 RepID=A0A517NRK3_9BACT|nr:Thiosulfate sulfurtransferase PspE precursor [Planctomycetes bacterium K23_9]
MRTIFCLAIVFVVGCSTNETTQVSAPESTATTEPANDSLSLADKLVIDVRSQEEWDKGHFETAVHIPHTEIAERISEVTEDKDAQIVLYCAVGGRAGKAKTVLEGLGFSHVENAGGLDDLRKLAQ